MAFHYQFPLLTVEEATAYLQDYGIEITASDFQRPNSEKWKLYYQTFLEMLTNRTCENLMQQPIQNDFEYPELYEDATPIMSFTVALRRLLCSCGFTDFTIADIIEPSPKRLKKIVSAVINFHRFSEGRLKVFNAMKDELERFREQHDHLIKENDAMKQKINQIKSDRAQQEPEVLKIQGQIDQLTQKMDELLKKQATMDKDRAELKAKIAEGNVLRDNLKLSVLNAKKEQDKIAQKIVHSPERVKNEQEYMKQKLDELKTSLKEKRERLNQTKSLHEQLETWETESKKCLKAVQAISQEKEKEKAIQIEKSQVQDAFLELQNVLKDMNNKKDHAKHVSYNREEKLAELTLQQQMKLKSSQETLDQLKREKDIIVQESQTDDEIVSIQKEKEKLKDAMLSEKKNLEEKVKTVNYIYSELLEHIHNNQNQMAPLLKAIEETSIKVVKND